MEIDEFVKALLSINRIKLRSIFADHLEHGNPVMVIENLIFPAMQKIGEGWTQGTIALCQVYMAGVIIEELVDEILPPGDPSRIGQPKMAIAALEDYHLLGKRIIYSMLRASGYELLDYGRVTVDETIEKVKADGIEILLISTLMLPSALRIKDLKAELLKSGSTTRLVVGGAPFRFDDRLWLDVDADATAKDATETLKVLNQLVKEMS